MPRTLSVTDIATFRGDLCGVAAHLFAERGYDGVTMRAIAGELGVSPMTPYGYFESKGQIYAEIRAQAFQRFGARVAQAADPALEPLVRLRALFGAYLQFAIDEPGAYRIMFELTPPDDAQPDDSEMARAGETWTPLLETLHEAVSKGLLAGDPLTLAHVCWVLVHGLASLQISGRLSFGRSLDDILDPAFETLLHGTLARPARTTRE